MDIDKDTGHGVTRDLAVRGGGGSGSHERGRRTIASNACDPRATRVRPACDPRATACDARRRQRLPCALTEGGWGAAHGGAAAA
eukprot:6780473-Prymnesium_polylepis.1